jgi:hypothetical protein
MAGVVRTLWYFLILGIDAYFYVETIRHVDIRYHAKFLTILTQVAHLLFFAVSFFYNLYAGLTSERYALSFFLFPLPSSFFLLPSSLSLSLWLT